MMEPIFDRTGTVIGWLHEGRFLDRSNLYRGFLSGEAIHSMSGNYLGKFQNGFIRDKNGKAVAFIKGASGGPILPLAKVPQIPPIPPIPPLKSIPSIPPIPQIPSLAWGTDWESFLNGQ